MVLSILFAFCCVFSFLCGFSWFHFVACANDHKPAAITHIWLWCFSGVFQSHQSFLVLFQLFFFFVSMRRVERWKRENTKEHNHLLNPLDVRTQSHQECFCICINNYYFCVFDVSGVLDWELEILIFHVFQAD